MGIFWPIDSIISHSSCWQWSTTVREIWKECIYGLLGILKRYTSATHIHTFSEARNLKLSSHKEMVKCLNRYVYPDLNITQYICVEHHIAPHKCAIFVSIRKLKRNPKLQ